MSALDAGGFQGVGIVTQTGSIGEFNWPAAKGGCGGDYVACRAGLIENQRRQLLARTPSRAVADGSSRYALILESVRYRVAFALRPLRGHLGAFGRVGAKTPTRMTGEGC